MTRALRTILAVRIIRVTVASRARPALDDTHALRPELLLLEAHELGDEADVGRDALAPLEHELIRLRERPPVRVDQVRHHCRHGARLPGFAVHVRRRRMQSGIV